MTGLEAAVAVLVALIAGGPAWLNARRQKGAQVSLEARLDRVEGKVDTAVTSIQSLTAAVSAVSARQDAHEAAYRNRGHLRVVKRLPAERV